MQSVTKKCKVPPSNTSAKCHPPRRAKCKVEEQQRRLDGKQPIQVQGSKVQSARVLHPCSKGPKCKGAKSFPTNFRLAKVKSASGTTLVQTSSHYCFFPSPFHLCYTPPNSQKVAKHILNKCLTVLSSVEVGGQGWPNFNRF